MANFRASLKFFWKNRPHINCLILLSSLPIERRGCRQKKEKGEGKKGKKQQTSKKKKKKRKKKKGKKKSRSRTKKRVHALFLTSGGRR